jgi:hypothetical protein
MRDDETLFSISVGRVQAEAKEYINRKLTESELLIVKKGIEEGLNFDIEAVFEAAIDNAVESSKKEKRIKHLKNRN